MPNNVSAAAFAIAASSGGAVYELEDGMEAMKKAGGAGYKAPSARAAATKK